LGHSLVLRSRGFLTGSIPRRSAAPGYLRAWLGPVDNSSATLVALTAGLFGLGIWKKLSIFSRPREIRALKRSGIVAVGLAGVVVAYFAFYPTTSYRFRITLNIDTPQGLKSGSSVMEVRTWRYPAWMTLGNNTGESILKGEAVFVDLGPGEDGKPRNIVALMALGPLGKGHEFYLLPGIVFEPLWQQKQSSPEFRAPSSELPKLPVGTKAELRGDLIPTLVTFSNVNDPKTVRAVPPDNFGEILGKGISFRDAQIEIVASGAWPFSLVGLGGEPLTRGIEQKLPAFRQLLAEDKVFRTEKAGDPFRVNSGYLQRGF
jgi:hypothetical protein